MNSKIIIAITIAIVLSGLFYWFQYRPAEIRKQCVVVAQEAMKNSGGFEIVTDRSILEGNKVYSDCLAENGMPSEKLYK